MESKSEEWVQAHKVKIKEVFDLFDRDKTDAIMQEEIGTVMRALGAYPSERNITVDILPHLTDDEGSGFVTYEKFERKMLSILANREYEPDTIDVLLQAFRTIDTKNDGFIPADELESLLTLRGIEFRPKEIESFLTVAKDPDTGNIYYEDYCALLVLQR
jgi:calmodulin